MAERKKYFEGAGTAAYERKKAYEKEHYKRQNIVLTPELLDQINQAAADAGQSKNSWIVDAILDKLKTEQLKIFLISYKCWNFNIYEDFTPPTIP